MVSEYIQTQAARKMCLACNREFADIVTACPYDGTVLVPLAYDPLVGTTLAGRYQILSVIGHGGMGVVYKARHDLMDRTVAIKMLKIQLVGDSMSVKRFQQEAKAASRLKHPHVITLYDFGITTAGQPYLVMDYLEGISLADVIKKSGQVNVDRCLRIFSQACAALDHAHHQGVIHRDLKPGNIMLTETEEEHDFVKVVDFGVAKLMPWAGATEEAQRLTQTGEVCGSPVYMSPEQCIDQPLDPRSDIYSMGIVAYEAITGKLPLFGKNMVDTMSKHINETPRSFSEVRPDLYIPEKLEQVILRALSKDPAHRHQTMSDFANEMQLAVPKPSMSVAALATSTPQANRVNISDLTTSAPHPFKRNRFSTLILAGLVLALTAVLATITLFNQLAPKKPQPALSNSSKLQPAPILTTAHPLKIHPHSLLSSSHLRPFSAPSTISIKKLLPKADIVNNLSLPHVSSSLHKSEPPNIFLQTLGIRPPFSSSPLTPPYEHNTSAIKSHVRPARPHAASPTRAVSKNTKVVKKRTIPAISSFPRSHVPAKAVLEPKADSDPFDALRKSRSY